MKMPYILKENRTLLMDEAISALVSEVKVKGDLNYLISELVARLIERDGGMSYTRISNWIDGVHGAERELTRRLLNPYEDMMIRKNGDVETIAKLLDTIEDKGV
jgi:hypothetical protein